VKLLINFRRLSMSFIDLFKDMRTWAPKGAPESVEESDDDVE